MDLYLPHCIRPNVVIFDVVPKTANISITSLEVTISVESQRDSCAAGMDMDKERRALIVGDHKSCNKEIRRWANGRPQNTEGPFELLENNPAEDRLSESVQETSSRPPLIMVMGRSWSPSIYGAVRLLGNTVDVAWRMAFIHPLTFI
jgi:hypothetical protein